MTSGTRTFLTILVVALFTSPAVYAWTHHRTLKRSAPAATTTEVGSPPEKNRDPADVALDRQIKGICRGC